MSHPSWRCVTAVRALFKTLKQQMIVDNRPGAGGTVGSDVVAKALHGDLIVAAKSAPGRLSYASSGDGNDNGTGEALLAEGAEPLAGSAADFAELMRAESEKWAQVIRATGVKAD